MFRSSEKVFNGKVLHKRMREKSHGSGEETINATEEWQVPAEEKKLSLKKTRWFFRETRASCTNEKVGNKQQQKW